MMKRFNFNAATKAMLGASLLSLVLTGCGGSDGKDGEDGKPGPVGSPISKVAKVKAQITAANVDDKGFLTINFDLTDANGAAVFGLTNTDISAVSFGRMGNEDEVGTTDIPGSPRDIWLSYFNKDKKDGFYTGSDYFQGKNCSDCLTDNGDGSYTLKLNKEINTLGKYAYDATATSGVYLGIQAVNATGSKLVENSFHYWQPSSNTDQAKPKAAIANETCQSCHRLGQDGALAMHGGKHVTLESCTFCHTDNNSYMKSDKDAAGNVIKTYKYDGSIKGMAHEIHSHSYYNGIYPQSASNCITCHKPDETLEMADIWKADLDTATCMNCHNSQYAVPSWHWNAEQGQIADGKENCVSCHNDPNGKRGAERGHYVQNDNAQAAATKVIFNSMTYNADTKTVVANMSIKHGDTLATLAQIDPTPYKYGGFTSAIVFNGIVSDDFIVNYQKIGFNKFAQAADGTIDVTFTDDPIKVVKMMETPNVTVTLSSQLHLCFNGKGAVADCKLSEDGKTATNAGPYSVSDTYYFKADGSKVVKSPRVQHAEMKDCQQCHTTSITHRFTNDLDGCASCHNGTRDRDGKNSSNLAYIVHSKHYIYSDPERKNLFFKKAECQACHGKDGFSLSKIAADAAPVAFGKTADGTEQLLVSPQTAACVSCHQGPYALSSATAGHIESMGGVLLQDSSNLTVLGIPASQYDPTKVQESCSTCHNDANILEKHANWGAK